jgi:hypothetical protein
MRRVSVVLATHLSDIAESIKEVVGNARDENLPRMSIETVLTEDVSCAGVEYIVGHAAAQAAFARRMRGADIGCAIAHGHAKILTRNAARRTGLYLFAIVAVTSRGGVTMGVPSIYPTQDMPAITDAVFRRFRGLGSDNEAGTDIVAASCYSVGTWSSLRFPDHEIEYEYLM